MKILITGGAGFMGSNFIHYMIGKYPKYKFVNLDKLTYAGNLDNLKSIEKEQNYKFIRGDICNKSDVKKAIKGVDIIIHFAAESHVDRSISGPSEFIKTNIIGTQVLLEESKDTQIKKFHYISTDEVFGSLPLNSKKKFNILSNYSPNSPYSASKASAEHIVKAYYHTYNLPITISNCTNNYGPYQFPEKIIPLFIINAIQNKKLPLYGKGLAIRDYIYVDDHSRAIDLIIHKGKIGSRYLLGGNSEQNGISIAKMIIKKLDASASLITFVKDRSGHDMHYAIDFHNTTKELGWKPEINFSEGINKTIKWYQDNSWWWKKIIK